MCVRTRSVAGVMTLLLLGWLGPLDVQAGTLDEIKARGKLIVGLSAITEPYEFMKDGKIVGYDVEIVELFAKNLGVSLEVVDVPWTGILGGLASKRFDMMHSGATITEERMKRVNFGVPYGENLRVICVRKGTTGITKPEDLANKVIGTELGSGTERYLRFLDEQLKAKSLSGIKDIKTYDNLADGYMDLENGRLHAVIDMKFRVILYNRKKPGVFEDVGPIGPRQFVGAGFRKDDDGLLNAYNAFMTRIRKDGTLNRLQEKWLGFTFEDLPWEPKVMEKF